MMGGMCTCFWESEVGTGPGHKDGRCSFYNENHDPLHANRDMNMPIGLTGETPHSISQIHGCLYREWFLPTSQWGRRPLNIGHY